MSEERQFVGSLLDEEFTRSLQPSLPSTFDYMSADEFHALLLKEGKTIFLKNRRVLIDKVLLIHSFVQVIGEGSTLTFEQEGQLRFQQQETDIGHRSIDFNSQILNLSSFHDEFPSKLSASTISGCNIETDHDNVIQGSNLIISDCSVSNKLSDSMLNHAVTFSERLELCSTIVNGFRCAAVFVGRNQVQLLAKKTNVYGGCLFIASEPALRGNITMSSCAFTGLKEQLSDGQAVVGTRLDLRFDHCDFSNLQFGLSISNLEGGNVILDGCQFRKLESMYAIAMKMTSLSIVNCIISGANSGIQLEETFCVVEQQISPIIMKDLKIQDMADSGIKLRNTICAQLTDSYIHKCRIGLNIGLSTYHLTDCTINPFIITINNCNVCWCREQAFFLCASCQEPSPVYLQVSNCTVAENLNAIGFAQIGQSRGPRNLTFYNCCFQSNGSFNYEHQDFSVKLQSTNNYSMQRSCNIQ